MSQTIRALYPGLQVYNVSPGGPARNVPVEVVSATKASNYTLNNGATVLAANFADDARTIVLTTSVLSPGRTYTLTVNGVKDRATTPNTIAPNSQKTFTLDYTPLDASNVIGGVTSFGLNGTCGGTGGVFRLDRKNVLDFVSRYLR